MARCKRVKNTCIRLLRRKSPPPCGDRPIALTCESETSIRSPPAYPGSITSENSGDGLKKESHEFRQARNLRRCLLSLLRESETSLKQNISEAIFGLRTGLFLLGLCASKASFYLLDAAKFLGAVVICIFAAPVLILFYGLYQFSRKEPRIYFDEDVYFVP